jgi:hypothetical protein
VSQSTFLPSEEWFLCLISDPAPIKFEVDKPKLHLPVPSPGTPTDHQVGSRGAPELGPSVPPVRSVSQVLINSRDLFIKIKKVQSPDLDIDMLEVGTIPEIASPAPPHQSGSQHIPDDGSTTESSDDNDPQPAYVTNLKAELQIVPKKSNSPAPSVVKGEPSDGSDDPITAHRLPAKKARATISSSSDDNVSVPQRSNPKSGAARGTRQPIRRGGKRF